MKALTKVLLKSLLFLLLFTIIVVFLLVRTPTGNKIGYFLISEKISKKSNMKIKVRSLNFKDYPNFTGELRIEDEYRVDIAGVLSLSTLDLNFGISSNCIKSNLCTISDDVNITGKVYGKIKDFNITASGKILDGNITLSGSKKHRIFQDIDLVLSDINSTKFFTALDIDPLFNGRSNAHLHFDTFHKKNLKGQLTYHAVDNNYSGEDIKVTLDTKVNIDNNTLHFDIDLALPSAKVEVREGVYHKTTKNATALYTLDIQELADLEKLTDVDVRGPFYASGNLILDKKVKMKGHSESFGGILHIAYEKKKFHFDLEDVAFNDIMQRFKQNPLLDAKMVGTIDYDLEEKKMETRVKLKQVQFLQKELNEIVLEKFGHKLNKEIFPDSSFEANYEEDILSSYLKIANKNNYLVFQNTKLNAVERSIDTIIDFQIQGHKIAGKLYARNDGYARDTLDTYLNFDGLVEKHYKLKLNGPLGKTWINMQYELSAARLPSHLVIIEDDVNITGQLYGPYNRLYIKGEGTALDGHVKFDGLKVYNELKDFSFKMTDIHANKLYTLTGITGLPHGKASIEAHMKYLNQENKKGTLTYTLRDAYYETLPLKLTTDIDIDKNVYNFTANIDLNGTKTTITKGSYDESKERTHASYTLDIQDLAQVEVLLGSKYKGSFFARGEIDYKDSIKIRGLSKSLGGMTDFLYKEEILYIDFEDTSFKDILTLLDYPTYLEAKTNGSINYDFKKELLLVDTKLDDARFLKSDIVQKAHKKAGINLLYETFDASELKVKYQNDIITGRIKLSNLKSHIYLTNAKIDTKQKSINAYFDINIQNRELTGKIYGSLSKPKINLDMQRLIQHEMDRQIDSMGGKAPREMMEGMPMGSTAKDVVTGTAGSFIGIFF